jgi:hypothetical protein
MHIYFLFLCMYKGCNKKKIYIKDTLNHLEYKRIVANKLLVLNHFEPATNIKVCADTMNNYKTKCSHRIPDVSCVFSTVAGPAAKHIFIYIFS